MRTRIALQIQHLAKSELRALIPDSEIAWLKEKDPNPVFKVFAVGQEGKAEGMLLGAGKRVLQYMQGAVRAIAEHLFSGTPAFAGHATGTNEHGGRLRVGEVVATAVRELKGKVSALAAVYIYPEFRDHKLDVASIEAEVTGEEDRVFDVHRVTGLALGDGDIEQPGFAGATLLGTVQAFIDKAQHQGGGGMDKNEVKAAVKELKLSPSDLFGEDDLFADGTVKVYVSEQKQAGFAAAEGLQEKLDTTREDFQKKMKAKDDELEGLQTRVVLSKTTEVLEKVAGEEEVTDPQLKFMKGRLETFSSDAKNADELQVAVKEHVTKELVEFGKMADLFGAKTGDGKEDDTSASPAGDGTGAVDGSDLTDPKNNDLIPA